MNNLFKLLVSLSVLKTVQGAAFSSKMDNFRNIQNLTWCKADWCFPSMGKETNELLRQCIDMPDEEVTDDIDALIERSEKFPVPFPIDSMRLKTLKQSRPIEELRRAVSSTYPILHERALLLMTHFLIFKREFGSPIEKALYKDMTLAEFIDRLLLKRAVTFMGPKDTYKLITGEKDNEGWELVGSSQQKPPLLLSSVLSYDEMKLSALLYVSGRTEFINNGARDNAGAEGEGEERGVIIGLIGPRFERKGCMDYEDILITEQQNTPENGYGEEVTPTTCLNVLKTTYVRNNQSTRHMWRQMWSEFYQVHSYTYPELAQYTNLSPQSEQSQFTERYVPLAGGDVMDNTAYYRRVSVALDTALIEASHRAREDGKEALLNMVGIGLGVWRISKHQKDIFILSCLERTRALLKRHLLDSLAHVNLAYIRPSDSIVDMFTQRDENNQELPEKCILVASSRHPRGGIKVTLENREPSAKLTGELEGKLLVTAYPWDGNALPGNEFWLGSLTGSGDPAAAASSQISELHNPHINTNVKGSNTRVAAGEGVVTLKDYCRAAVGWCQQLGSLTGSGDPAAAASSQISELHNPHINTNVKGSNTRVAAGEGVVTLKDYCRAAVGWCQQ